MTDQRPSLVLADVDGTLVTPTKVLTERALRAVTALQEKGVAFSIVSGRPPRGMRRLVESLELKIPYAAFNGGAIIEPDFKVLKTRELSVDTVQEALDGIFKAHLDDAWIYTEKDWYVRKPALLRVGVESGTVQFSPEVLPDYKNLPTKILKIVGLSEDHPRVERCEKELQVRLGDRASVSRSQPYYVDVTHPLANKGRVLEDLCEYLKIEPSQAVTIGDMPSDILMFKKSGFSIAMGNSSEEVKSHVNEVTASNQDEGFAKAMEALLRIL